MKSIFKFGSNGSNDGQFKMICGLAVSTNNLIYVSDRGNNRIQCFSSDGTFICKWGKYGYSDGEFIHPTGLAIAAHEPCGEMKKDFMILTQSIPKLNKLPLELLLICISYVGTEHLYVIDSGNCRIQVFDVSEIENFKSFSSPEVKGKFIRKWGKQGNGDGEFKDPMACAIMQNRRNKVSMIYITDYGNNRLQVFDVEGKFIQAYENKFSRPIGISASNELIFVADDRGIRRFRVNGLSNGGLNDDNLNDENLNNSLSEIKANDEWWNTQSVLPILSSGVSILVDHAMNMVYVCDTGNDRIVAYRTDGTYVGKWGRRGKGDDEFRLPFAIAKGFCDNILYIADTANSRIVVMKIAAAEIKE